MRDPARSGLFALLLLCAGTLGAQDYAEPTPAKPAPEARPLRDRIWFGGGVGIAFGTVTNIAVEPMVGYKVTRNGKLSTGIGASYQYFRDNQGNPPYEASIYGGRVFSRYRIIEQLFAHAEYANLNLQLNYTDPTRFERRWVPFLLVGGGYSAHLGGRSYLTATILWDVLQDPDSPYGAGEPWIGAGVGFGF